MGEGFGKGGNQVFCSGLVKLEIDLGFRDEIKSYR